MTTPQPQTDRDGNVLADEATRKARCTYCAEGVLLPMILDDDGTRSSITGQPGVWSHAYEDAWWPCAGVESAPQSKQPCRECGNRYEHRLTCVLNRSANIRCFVLDTERALPQGEVEPDTPPPDRIYLGRWRSNDVHADWIPSFRKANESDIVYIRADLVRTDETE